MRTDDGSSWLRTRRHRPGKHCCSMDDRTKAWPGANGRRTRCARWTSTRAALSEWQNLRKSWALATDNFSGFDDSKSRRENAFDGGKNERIYLVSLQNIAVDERSLRRTFVRGIGIAETRGGAQIDVRPIRRFELRWQSDRRTAGAMMTRWFAQKRHRAFRDQVSRNGRRRANVSRAHRTLPFANVHLEDAARLRDGRLPRDERFFVGVILAVADRGDRNVSEQVTSRGRGETNARRGRRRCFARIDETFVKTGDFRIVDVEVDRGETHLIHPFRHFISSGTREILSILVRFVDDAKRTEIERRKFERRGENLSRYYLRFSGAGEMFFPSNLISMSWLMSYERHEKISKRRRRKNGLTSFDLNTKRMPSFNTHQQIFQETNESVPLEV